MTGSQQFTVTTTPQVIAAAPAGTTIMPVGWFYLANGAAAIYLGGSGVSATTGALVAINGTFTGFLFPGDQIWAYCATTSTVTILQTGG